MKPDDLLYSTGETVEYLRQYIQQQLEYIQLESIKRIAKTTANLITAGVVFLLMSMIAIFLSIAAGFYLGDLWGSYALAFLCIAGFYFVVGMFIIFFKEAIITNLVLNMIIRNILD